MRHTILTITIASIAALAATDAPPSWVLPAIAFAETSSTIDAQGTVHRVDFRNDRDSLGAFQCRLIAFLDVQKQFPNRKHSDLATDDQLGARVCLAYLTRWKRPGESWLDAACHWNGGPRSVPAAYRLKLLQWCKSHHVTP